MERGFSGILEEIIQMLGTVDDWTANKLELIFKKYMEKIMGMVLEK